MTKKIVSQFIKYTVVGGLAFLIDYGMLLFLTSICQVFYIVSASMSFLVASIINYFLSTKFVFDNRIIKNRNSEKAVFFTIGLVGLIFNDLIMVLFTSKLNIYYGYSKLISTAVVFFWNFTARKIILF